MKISESFETVIKYKSENKVVFDNPAGIPILTLNQEFENGKLLLQDWFQRDYCWSKKQVVALVHTLLNTPTLLPEIVIIVDGTGENEKQIVADGHQRLKSILEKVFQDEDFIYKSNEIATNTRFYGVSRKQEKEWVKFKASLLSTNVTVKTIKNISCSEDELKNVKSYVFRKWNNGTAMKPAEVRGGVTSDLNVEVIQHLKDPKIIPHEIQKNVLNTELKENKFNEFIERLFYHFWFPNISKDPSKEEFDVIHNLPLQEDLGKIKVFNKLVISACNVVDQYKKTNGTLAFKYCALRDIITFSIELFRKNDLKNITQFEQYLESLIDKIHTAYVRYDGFKAYKNAEIDKIDNEVNDFWYQGFASHFGSGQDSKFKLRREFLEKNKEVWGNLNTCDKNRGFTNNQKQFKYLEQGRKCLGHLGEGCYYTSDVLTISQMEGDHIIEHAEEGSSETENLQMLCKSCHKDKTSEYMSRRLELVL